MTFIMEYWTGVLFGFVVSAFGVLYRRLSQRVKQEVIEQGALKLGVQALLRDRIIQTYNYYTEKGYCPIYARENVDALYTQYYGLGGNGTVKDLIQNMKKLPYEKEVKKGEQ